MFDTTYEPDTNSTQNKWVMVYYKCVFGQTG